MDDRSVESHVALPVESAEQTDIALLTVVKGMAESNIICLIFLRLLIKQLNSILSTLNIFIILNHLNKCISINLDIFHT